MFARTILCIAVDGNKAGKLIAELVAAEPPGHVVDDRGISLDRAGRFAQVTDRQAAIRIH